MLNHQIVQQAMVVDQEKIRSNTQANLLALFDSFGNPLPLGGLGEFLARPQQQLVRYSTGDNSELVETIPIPVTADTKDVIYSIEIPDLELGDILFVMVDMQATSEQTYNVMFSSQIIAGESVTANVGTEISEGAATNITPDNHHMQFCRVGSLVVTNTARNFINFVAASAASGANPGDTLVIDQDYGRMTILRIRTSAGVLGTLPIVSDDVPSLETVYSSAKILSLLDDLPEVVAGQLELSSLEADVLQLQQSKAAAEVFAASPVSTLSRQNVGASTGTVGSGTNLAARARVTQSGSYSKIRFCTGTTAPAGLTDFRVGVWNASDGQPLATSANVSATITAASTLYEIALTAPINLTVGQDVFIGIAVIGTTPGTYRGNASFTSINNLEPAISKARTGWAGGALSQLTVAYSGMIWAELIP